MPPWLHLESFCLGASGNIRAGNAPQIRRSILADIQLRDLLFVVFVDKIPVPVGRVQSKSLNVAFLQISNCARVTTVAPTAACTAIPDVVLFSERVHCRKCQKYKNTADRSCGVPRE